MYIHENLIRVNINWMQRKVTIIEIYALSEDEEVNTKDHFFAKLNDSGHWKHRRVVPTR